MISIAYTILNFPSLISLSSKQYEKGFWLALRAKSFCVEAPFSRNDYSWNSTYRPLFLPIFLCTFIERIDMILIYVEVGKCVLRAEY